MKFFLTIIIYLLLGLQSVSAQDSKYTENSLGIINKNRITALVMSAKDRGLSGSAWGNSIERARFNLSQSDKIELITALNKALSWGTINNARKLSFQKRVAKINSYSEITNWKTNTNNSTGYMNVVFVGKEDGSHSILLYKDGFSMLGIENEFNIEKPGQLFWHFDSDQQIKDLITTLGKQTADLDEIFK
ncbi:hypothetical protein E4631_25000 [Hymenobacter sp. UV11]|uniref:hypothetical protein n=1 Tax=Hymenobacter sp. UV11 TaxID=1849735 RepID=UPI00105DF7E5|nr:hypothetical protein [Hymenobacter sp. UV11]TDN37228.1 hypothetical protein A8B98_04945 [Hymenobacter sp. UV11]TFZ62534.1 hypothetical protein E4631_25000 [Hymenobacter sp. UV11]